MNKKYLKYQIKQHLPLIIISLVAFCSISMIVGLSFPWYRTLYKTADGTAYYPGSNNLAMIGFPSVVALLLATFIPLSTYHYRLKASSADMYLQTPFKPKRFRYQRILFTLCLTLALTTFMYWFASGIYALNCLRPLPTPSTENIIYEPAYINYGYVALGWLYLLAGVTGQFFISSFAISLGRNVVYALIGLALFEFVFAVIPGNLYNFFTSFTPSKALTYDTALFSAAINLGFTPIVPGYLIFALFYPRIIGYENAIGNLEFLITGQVLFFAGAIAAGVYSFLAPEPSGEHAGKLGFHPRWFVPAYHIATAIGGLNTYGNPLGISGSFGVNIIAPFILSLVLWGLRYYLVLALVKGTFKFKKNDWIWFASVMGFVVICSIVAFAISTTIGRAA